MKNLESLAMSLKKAIRASSLTPAMLEKRSGVSREVIKDFMATDNLKLSQVQALASFFGLELMASGTDEAGGGAVCL
jgi:hypothetical protein